MLIVLSPAKTLDFSPTPIISSDAPKFRKETSELIGILKKLKTSNLMKLMSIKEKLGELNYQRYQSFSSKYTKHNAKVSILAFKGDVYLGLEAETFDEGDLAFAQDRLRILSGLYGILKPMDKIQPYRLEMGTKLKNAKGKNLYDFWGDKITKNINRDMAKQQERILVNLASNEYFKAVQKKNIKGEILDIDFKEYKNGELKFISFTAKKARGLMSQYIIKNKIEEKEQLKGFNYEDYYFEASLSSESKYTFVR